MPIDYFDIYLYIYLYIYGVRYPTDVKSAGFQSQQKAYHLCSHTEELWYNETICMWMIYIYIYIYIRYVREEICIFWIYLFCSYICACFQLVAFVREPICPKALLMGYSMRLELTRVCSLNDFKLVIGLYRGHPLFFLECIYFCLLYTSLIFDMFLLLLLLLCVCVCVCVCVLEWFGISLTVIFPLCSMYDYQYIKTGDVRGVMVIVAGYGHGDTSSNPGPDWLYFT